MVLDSSVVVAAFAPWHEHHEVAREVVRLQPALSAHAELEAYSVLTRLPEPFRAEPALVAAFLRETFPAARLVLKADDHLPTRLAALDISGGAVYDALIALTAHAADADLVTLDQRAAQTYRRCNVRSRLLP